MNDLLQAKLKQLAEDELMLQAIRTVVIEQIEKLKPSVDEISDNRILGEKFRAAEESFKLLRGILDDITSYKGQRSSKQLINKGK